MSSPIAINEHSYLSGRACTSHRSVMAYSTFSTFTGTMNGSDRLAFSWYLHRAAELSDVELALLTELLSGEPRAIAYCQAAELLGYIYRDRGKRSVLYRGLRLISSLRYFTHTM